MKIKLTDIELSKILTRADSNELNHRMYTTCVAGTCYDGSFPYAETPGDMDRCEAISKVLWPDPLRRFDRFDYPTHNAEEMLRYLESRGIT